VVRGEGDYGKLADTIMRSEDPRDQQDTEYMKKLGQPDIFIPDEELNFEGDLSGWGYWRVDHGVLAIHRYPKGRWNVRGFVFYKKDWINRMRALLTCPVCPEHQLPDY